MRKKTRNKQIISLPISYIKFLKDKAEETFIPLSRQVQIALENYYGKEIKEFKENA